ncbi:MAG: alpha/beta hydrolase [Comamonas sp.]|jgi:pimeloyl-ACP methyl ester carboxylesterase|nr:alpha/beta hydrolase [Comamonas sp.]
MLHQIPLANPLEDQFADLPNGMRICYRSYGQNERPTIVLIAGLGLQLVSWPMTFIEGLVAEGLRVLTLDNRDMGRSTHLTQTPPPARWRLLMRMVPNAHYQIADMADDVAQLLEVLGISKAHVLGMSMGGMIAQNFAAQHPEKVLSLTSIFSTTGNTRVGFAAGSTLLRMLFRKAPLTLEDAQNDYVHLMRHIGNSKVPGIELAWRNYIAQAWLRANHVQAQQGYERQIAAIVASGDRSAHLYRIDTPTLVIHGDQDRIVHPSGGTATARSISGAQMQTLMGMRHQIDESITPDLLRLVIGHVRAAQHAAATN